MNNSAVDDLLGDLVDLPGDQPPTPQKQKPAHLKLVELGDLPEAPENLGNEEEDNQFDAYSYFEDIVKQVNEGKITTEEAARTIENGIESITKIIHGIQQATVAMAKAFQGADDAHTAKIVSLVLAQQQSKANVTDVSVTLGNLDKKVTSPLRLLLIVFAGTVLGVGVIKYLFH